MDRRAFSLSLAGVSLAHAVPVGGQTGSSISPPGNPIAGASSFTQVGKEERPFADTAEAELARQTGSGYLNHLWFGGDFPHFKTLRIRVYVDDETIPSIDMELGLGVGVGFEDPTAPWGNQFCGITGAPSGIFLNYRIPFSTHIRVTAELPQGVARDTVFWWIVGGVQNLPLQISGLALPASSRLHLHKVVNRNVQPLDEFDLCRVAGAGMVFQVTMAAKSTSFDFMEGQMRAYLADSKEPQFLSSGLEDYFLGTYYFNRGLYHLPQAGLTHRDDTNFAFSAYRFHDLDPILFQQGIRLTCRCGEKRGSKVFGPSGKPSATTYTTYTWTYEWS